MLTYQLHKLEQEVSRLFYEIIYHEKEKLLVVIFKMFVTIRMNFLIIILFRTLTQMHGYSTEKLFLDQSIYSPIQYAGVLLIGHCQGK